MWVDFASEWSIEVEQLPAMTKSMAVNASSILSRLKATLLKVTIGCDDIPLRCKMLAGGEAIAK